MNGLCGKPDQSAFGETSNQNRRIPPQEYMAKQCEHVPNPTHGGMTIPHRPSFVNSTHDMVLGFESDWIMSVLVQDRLKHAETCFNRLNTASLV